MSTFNLLKNIFNLSLDLIKLLHTSRNTYAFIVISRLKFLYYFICNLTTYIKKKIKYQLG